MSLIDEKCINTLRVFGAEVISKAKSGHPGIVLDAAPMLHTLFTRHLNINSDDEKWINRDRFVLSAGHGSILLYTLLHLSGYNITLDDLINFRQKGSITPGHPEYNHTPGIEVSTGPLGQGIATAVGMAISEKYLGAKFNKNELEIINNYTYVLCGDGDLQEGITMEAMSLAGHLGLGGLIVLFDSNDIQLDGEVSYATSDNIKAKVEAMNWEYIKVLDGNNCDEIDKAISSAKSNRNKPTLIEIKTIIGYGAPNSGESSIHGKPMPEDDVNSLRKFLKYDEKPLTIPDDVEKFYKYNVIKRGYNVESNWNSILIQYENEYPAEFKEFTKFMYNDFKFDDLSGMPTYLPHTKESTRKVMGKVLDYMSSVLPNLMGGSADLTASTMVKGADGVYSQTNPLGRNIKFGVREHAMGAITNGITLYGGLRGFCAGFFVFSDYMKPAMRQASIMKIPSLFLFSHDTVCVGEDGPTHQPVEQLTMIRSLPNMNLFRPADACEMASALAIAYRTDDCPTTIVSTRQAVENLDCTKFEGVSKGAYIAYEPKTTPKAILLTCGSELSLCLEVAKKFESENVAVRVVSMPSMYLFDKQSDEYKDEILSSNIKATLAVEMGFPMPWYKYSRNVFGIETFGSSMPIKDIYEYYGFTVDNIYNVLKDIINK